MGLIFSIAACPGSISGGTATSSSAFTAAASRHVPRLCGKMTGAPVSKFLTFAPSSAMTPAPSKPGVAGKVGRSGYFPSIAFKSAGFIGAARISTTTSSGAGFGQGCVSTRRTSVGFPCVS